jgi:hypothetical protein
LQRGSKTQAPKGANPHKDATIVQEGRGNPAGIIQHRPATRTRLPSPFRGRDPVQRPTQAPLASSSFNMADVTGDEFDFHQPPTPKCAADHASIYQMFTAINAFVNQMKGMQCNFPIYDLIVFVPAVGNTIAQQNNNAVNAEIASALKQLVEQNDKIIKQIDRIIKLLEVRRVSNGGDGEVVEAVL